MRLLRRGWPQARSNAKPRIHLALALLCLLGAAPGQGVATVRPHPNTTHAKPWRVADIPLPARAPHVRPQSAQTGTATSSPEAQPQSQPQHSTPLASPVEEPDRTKPATGIPDVSGPETSENVPLPSHLENSQIEHAHAVLEKHCARCHQAGALQGRRLPDGGIGNILALDAIARNPALIRRGVPDASPLYQQMIARQMPSDVLRDGIPGEAPDATEIAAIRNWIKSLNGTAAADMCNQRTPLTRQSVAATVAQWLDAIGPKRASDTRFISLAGPYNACAGDAELTAYRDGVIAMLNALTWSPNPVAVETVGDTLVLLAVRLSDLGWTPEQWEDLARRVPPAARLELPERARKQTQTTIPMVAGDWLAHEVMQSDLYTRLLGLPPTLSELTRILGIDLDRWHKERTVRRGITLNSTLAAGPRVIERYAGPRGVLWMAHDYASGVDPRILDFPLLPSRQAGDTTESANLPKPVGSRALFTLPNGMPAFMMFGQDGTAQPTQIYPIAHVSTEKAEAATEHATTQIELPTRPREATKSDATDKSAPAAGSAGNVPHVTNGLPCSRCHALGPLAFEDQLANHLASDTDRGTTRERDVARQIVFGKAELDSAIADDRFAVSKALATMGIQAEAQFDRLDSVTGLAARYARELDLTAAAGELLIPQAQLQATLSKLSRIATPIATLATRLTLGRLTREEFELLRPALINAAKAAPPYTAPRSSSPTAVSPPSANRASLLPPPAPGTLRLWPDKISYNRDDRIILNVSAGQPCYLTLINIDKTGHASVLFPNEFSRDNLLKADEVKRLPAADALYYFSLQHLGTESFVAICEAGEPVPAGIKPDFTHMNFTDLGDWEEFLARSIKAAREPRVPLNNGDDIDRKRRREQPARPAPITSPAQSRAAVTVTIAP